MKYLLIDIHAISKEGLRSKLSKTDCILGHLDAKTVLYIPEAVRLLVFLNLIATKSQQEQWQIIFVESLTNPAKISASKAVTQLSNFHKEFADIIEMPGIFRVANLGPAFYQNSAGFGNSSVYSLHDVKGLLKRLIRLNKLDTVAVVSNILADNFQCQTSDNYNYFNPMDESDWFIKLKDFTIQQGSRELSKLLGHNFKKLVESAADYFLPEHKYYIPIDLCKQYEGSEHASLFKPLLSSPKRGVNFKQPSKINASNTMSPEASNHQSSVTERAALLTSTDDIKEQPCCGGLFSCFRL